MTEQKQQAVMMTAAERAEFEAFKAAQEKKRQAEKAKEERETYRHMVDEEIDRSILLLREVSENIKGAKSQVMEAFRSILEMKSDVMRLTQEGQRSHTFTNTAGDKRIVLGVYVTDGYLDTAEDGIAIVKEYIESLADSEKTRALVNMIMKLLSKDAAGSLKASRIIQLRKIADDLGDERFSEGVRIIEESFQPNITRQFIKAYERGDSNEWKLIPLGMTES